MEVTGLRLVTGQMGLLQRAFPCQKMFIVSDFVLKGNAGEFLGGPVVKIQ